MNNLHSIQEIKKVYDTGDKPVLVECNDLNNYVCKHGKGQRSCKSLFAEYFAYHCLEAFKVKLSPCAFIQVNGNHVLPTSECQPRYFKEVDCFGTELLNRGVNLNTYI